MFKLFNKVITFFSDSESLIGRLEAWAIFGDGPLFSGNGSMGKPEHRLLKTETFIMMILFLFIFCV